MGKLNFIHATGNEKIGIQIVRQVTLPPPSDRHSQNLAKFYHVNWSRVQIYFKRVNVKKNPDSL